MNKDTDNLQLTSASGDAELWACEYGHDETVVLHVWSL
jgi:hypothetical protein